MAMIREVLKSLNARDSEETTTSAMRSQTGSAARGNDMCSPSAPVQNYVINIGKHETATYSFFLQF
jgi:hypothetical protein